MKNLFKKSFASLALASAMTSSIFGGNAAYIDVHINYLHGDKAVLGYESANDARTAFNAGTNKSDLVELYIRVLDKDGQFADKDADGKQLANIRVLRNGGNVNNFNDGLTTPSGLLDNVIRRGLTSASSIATKAILNRNAGRYTLDYTDVNMPSLVDSLVVVAGGVSDRAISVNLTSRNVRGLIVRATTKDQLSSNGGIINASFADIQVAGDNNLNEQSRNIAQVLASKTENVPLLVYASTMGDDAQSGRFSTAPNLKKDATIVVVALGDYSLNGTTDTYINQTELNMVDGVAKGSISIAYGLPDSNGTNTTGHINFGNNVGGLGVSFIAYVKDQPTITNTNNPVVLNNGVYRTTPNNLQVLGSLASSDSLKVRSGYITGYKVGLFTTGRDTVARYFRDRSYVFLGNTNGLNGAAAGLDTQVINITAVDSLGNPGAISLGINDGNITGINTPTTVKVGNPAAIPFTLADGASSPDINVTLSGDRNMSTDANGTTKMNLLISDLASEVATTKTVLISFGGQLAGTAPAKITVSTVDVVGNTPDDIKGGLESLIDSVTVANDGRSTGTVIYTEQERENDYANMVVQVKVDSVTSDGNITLLAKVNNISTGEFNQNIQMYETNASAPDATNTAIGAIDNGWYKLEYNTTQVAPVILIGDYAAGALYTDGNISRITFDSPIGVTNLANWIAAVGRTATITLKGAQVADDEGLQIHSQLVDAYVQTTTSVKGASDFVGRTTDSGRPGDTIIDFDFTGNMITQNVGNTVATITFRGNDGDDRILAGIEGKPFLTQDTISARANTRTVIAPIPPSGRLSIALYGGYNNSLANNDANTTLYNIQNVTINDFTPVYTSRDRNELATPKAVDIDMNQEINVTIEAGDKKVASSVSIVGIGTTSEGEGEDGDSATSLPNAANNGLLEYLNEEDFVNATPNEVQTDPDTSIFTNVFYTLFDENSDLRILDQFGNEVNMESGSIADNYVLTMSDPECATVKMNGGASVTDPATIVFKDCAAAKPQSLIITAKGNENAFNKINFTKVVKQVENNEFTISLNVGSTDYNVANNDIIVKIVGDGNTVANDVTISVTNDAIDDEIVIMPVALISGKPFGTIVPSGSTLKQGIPSTGAYYVIRTDKAGTITVKADALILKKDADNNEDKPITGTLSFKVSLMDNDAPLVTAKATASGVIVTVNDMNLNTKLTTVKIHDVKGNEVDTTVTMGVSGVYTATLPQGVYTARVNAVDLAGNVNNIAPVFVIGNANIGTASVEEEAAAMLIAKKEYAVAGTFTSHNFGDDKAKNWIYTRKSDGKSFQLLGNTPSETDVFGWKEVDVKAGTSDVWYMINTGDGRFDWALTNVDGVAYKLKGAKSDNTFDFSGRLNLNASYKDGILTFTAK